VRLFKVPGSLSLFASDATESIRTRAGRARAFLSSSLDFARRFCLELVYGSLQSTRESTYAGTASQRRGSRIDPCCAYESLSVAFSRTAMHGSEIISLTEENPVLLRAHSTRYH